ncbi:MAG: DUF1552 domain-containing protein [Polyangiaceae bacterium]
MQRLLRRNFLRAATGAAIALPFLESTQACGGGAVVPKRFVIFQTGEGTLPSRWKPQSLANDALQLSEMLAPLAGDPNDASSPDLTNKLLVLSGVSNKLPPLHTSNGHNAPGHTLLTANVVDTTQNGAFDPSIEVMAGHRCLGPSIDHYLADRLGIIEPLNLAIGAADPGENRMFYRVKGPGDTGANPEAPLQADPIDAFQTNLVGLPSGSTSRADRFKARRGSVLDGVQGSFGALKKHVSRTDQRRIDEHLAAVRALEESLNYTPPLECGGLTQTVPDGFEVPGWPDYAQMNIQADLMVDIMVNVLACGARRVVTVQDTAYDGPPFEFLPEGPVEGWHAQVHNDPALGLGYSSNEDNPVLRAGYLYYARVFHKLLAKMDAIVEPNGLTLLDNSIVLWTSEFGWGQTHDPTNLPIVLAGSGQGRIKTGRHLSRPSATTGDLYTSILNAFDVNDTSFGYAEGAGLQNGPISGLVT